MQVGDERRRNDRDDERSCLQVGVYGRQLLIGPGTGGTVRRLDMVADPCLDYVQALTSSSDHMLHASKNIVHCCIVTAFVLTR